MKIVITDGATLNPGDLDWNAISQMGEISYFDSTPENLVAERCSAAEIIITNKTIIPANFIRQTSRLKMIAVSATGYNNVDVKAAKEKEIDVSNVPEYGTYSVAQHTFALILELVNHTGKNAASAKNDEWAASGTWSYSVQPVTELKDKVLGIVGFGRIGKQVAVIGKAFGMQIIYNNRSVKNDEIGRQVAMETIFSESDIVSLHCPLTENNKEFVNLHLLSTMKKNARLVNTSRGALINETDLLKALDDNLLTGAALDVLTKEPPEHDHPLVHHPRCIVTPHNAWLSFEARRRLMEVTAENIKCYLAGKPQNIVSK